MKKFIYNEIFGILTFEQKQDKLDERINKIYEDNQKSIANREELDKKIKEGLSEEENKYLKDTDLKEYFNEQKIKKLDEYTKNKEEELKKLREELNKKPRVIYQTEYYESSESKRIREQNALEEKKQSSCIKGVTKYYR